MPNIVGRDLQDATAVLETAGVIDLTQIGYFGIWPISIEWESGGTATSNSVLAQSPAATSSVNVNSVISLTVASLPIAVVYP